MFLWTIPVRILIRQSKAAYETGISCNVTRNLLPLLPVIGGIQFVITSAETHYKLAGCWGHEVDLSVPILPGCVFYKDNFSPSSFFL